MGKPSARIALIMLSVMPGMIGLAYAAHADGLISRVDLVGDLNYNVLSQSFSSNSVNYTGTGTLGYGGGLWVDLGEPQGIGFETGALYFLRKINIDVGSGASSNLVFQAGDTKVLQVPFNVIIGLNETVSLVVGGFDEIPIDSSFAKNNMGVDAGVRLTLPLTPTAAFMAQVQYDHGFTDQNGFHTNDFHGLAGFSFGGF